MKGLVVFFCLLVLTLSGCAVIPKIPNYKINAGERVGILVDISENPVHTHIGTTVFHNFTKRYSYKWDLDVRATEGLRNTLEKSGYSIIDLEKHDISYDEIQDIIVADREKWAINPKKKAIYDKLNSLGIKSIVLIKDVETLASLECGIGGCTPFSTDSYGLFSRSMLVFSRFYSVAAFDSKILVLKPIVHVNYDAAGPKIGRSGSYRHMVKVEALEDYTLQDIENISEEKWEPVKKSILSYMDKMIEKTPYVLQGEFPRTEE